MPSAAGIRAGKAYIELGVSNKLEAGLKRAQAQLSAFGGSVRSLGLKFAGVGAAMLTPLAAAAKIFADYGDSVAKAARRTGITTESLSELQFAAGQSGVEVSSLENGIRRMQRTIYDAGRGTSTATDALGELGITVEQLNKLSPEEQFTRLGDALSRIEDDTQRAAVAMTVFGRSGTEMLPLFENGAAGVELLRKEARELGLSLGGEDAAAAERLTDAMSRVKNTMRAVSVTIGAALAPALEAILARVTNVVIAIREWIGRNQGIVTAVATMGAALVGLGAALTAIGVAAQVSATGLGMLALVAKGVSLSVVGLTKVLHGLNVAIVFLMAHPLVAVLTAVAAAAIAVAVALRNASYHTAQLTSRASELRAEGDKQRQIDEDRLARLNALSQKERLNNTQMGEAKGILGSLRESYGTLGVTLDETTGKLMGVADAHAKVAAAMRSQALAQLDEEIAERRRNLVQLETEMRDVWFRSSKVAELGGQAREERSAMSAAAARRRELLGAPAAGASSMATTEEVEPPDPAKLAAESLKWARRVATLKLQQIEDEYDRERALIWEKYGYERQQAYDAGAEEPTLNKIDKAREFETDAVTKRQQEALAEEKRRQMDEEWAAKEEIWAADKQNAYILAGLKLQSSLKGIELAKAQLELEREQEIAAAKAAGLDLDVIEKIYAARRDLLDLEEANRKGDVGDRISAVGTFNPTAAFGLGAGGSVAERTAAATEQTAKNTKRALDNPNRGRPVFV